MTNLEIPLKDRSRMYRFFEMVPALLSYGAIILLVVLSFINPLFAAVYLLLIVTTVLIKATGIAFHMILGRQRMEAAQKIDWHSRLAQLEDPEASHQKLIHSKARSTRIHHQNIARVAANPSAYPKPSEIYNAVIIATYNEPYEVLSATLESLAKSTYDLSHLFIVIAYEERGGEAIKTTVARLQKEYKDTFGAFETVMHPKGLPDEVVGKGANITYAGHFLRSWLDKKQIDYSQVLVTTLDSDNRPHATYFDYATYEYIVHEHRKHFSYQPVSLFLNNIWDVPAAMRVVATGNSFWNIISAMRPHTLRNFASHSQPMDALVEMNFWSKRTIVEDGHQYWRSYFHFDGDYDVVPILVPIYQDAVMSDTYRKTLKAQFVQLRRWAYGASDVPYVATRVFTRKRTVPFWEGFVRFVRLLDGHVTLACIPFLATFGGWVPLLINGEAARSVAAHQLPEVLGLVQRIAMIGIIITVFLAFKLLPTRPERYKRHRTVGMLLQWLLMPITALVYSASSAFNSQTRLLLGKYLTVFDVTEKATVATAKRAKRLREKRQWRLKNK
jgi:hypothetical protein